MRVIVDSVKVACRICLGCNGSGERAREVMAKEVENEGGKSHYSPNNK